MRKTPLSRSDNPALNVLNSDLWSPPIVKIVPSISRTYTPGKINGLSPGSRKKLTFALSVHCYKFNARITIPFTFPLQEGITAAQLASCLENSAISEALPMKVKKPFQPPAVSVTYLTKRYGWQEKKNRCILSQSEWTCYFLSQSGRELSA